MVTGVPPRHPSLSHESLDLLLKRPWDPVGTALTQQKLKKLPGNPLLLIAPSGPSQSGSSHTGHAKRLKFWQVHLNSLGKTILTNMSGGSGVSVVLCLEQMIGALRTKVLEQKSHHPGRPIILVGWNVGALVACHVSLVESVSAVVCLGFPFTGIHGPRGDCEDPLLGSQTPTLFVIGQNACDCSIDQLQDLREHMRAETGMLVVGGADEQLRLSHRQKREEGLTQAMADRCIIDEVYQFLGSILSMNAGLPDLPPDVAQMDIRRKRKRKAPQDLIGALATDNNATAAAAVSPNVGKSPALASGTGRMSKRGGKAARLAAASGGSALTAEGSRTAPRKQQGRGGVRARPGPRKRMTLGLSHLGMHTARSSPNLQATSTATASAIASAPELSGLLQGIRISRPSDGDSMVVGGTRSLMGTSFPLTKVLTFSKLMEAGDAGNGGSMSGSATLLASAIRSGDASDKDKQQQQFLVKTGGSSGSPLAIPISMAQRLMAGGSSPLVHITGSGSSGSSQIHQLLTSIASSSASSSCAPTQPQAARVVSTTAASSVPAAGSAQSASKEGAVPGKAEAEDHVLGEKGDGEVSRKEAGGDKQSGQGSDSVPTTSAAKPSAVMSHISQKNLTAVSEAAQVGTPVMQSSQAGVTIATSVPLPSCQSGQVSMTKQTYLTSPATTGQLTSVSRAITLTGKTCPSLPHLTSLTSASLNNSAAEMVQSKPEGTPALQASPLMRSSLVQLAVTKSLINSVAVTTHSVLRVAGTVTQSGPTGSPTATTSILGGRSAVLISPAIAKSLSSAPTAILLSKSASGSGPLTTTAYKPAVEVLGKVSSVLETGVKSRQPAQSSPATASLVTVPISVSKSGMLSKAGLITKSDVISALKVSKAGMSAVSPAPPCPVCVSGSSVAAPPPLTTAASTSGVSSSGSSGGGRGGHKSASAVSYAASSKPVLPTTTSTRTRKIRTPKQYDL